MVKCSLRWSRIEFGFISSCHLAAVLSTLQSDAASWLGIVMVMAVLGSFWIYLRDRIRTFYRFGLGGLVALQPTLFFTQQFARIGCRGSVVETGPPGVIYMSEFLIVLSFRCSAVNAPPEIIHLVLWPDSLMRSEDRRLRRYLRFELPANLYDS